MDKFIIRFLTIFKDFLEHTFIISTGGEARTPDTRFWRPVLYQLSYSRSRASHEERLFIVFSREFQ